jgi:sugar lactone lactonase YvrE
MKTIVAVSFRLATKQFSGLFFKAFSLRRVVIPATLGILVVSLCIRADAQSVSVKAGGGPARGQQGRQGEQGPAAINLAVAPRAADTTKVAATPEFSMPAGYYASAQNISIIDSTPGATVYYTTDGSTPSTDSAVYSGPVRVGATTTLVAMAVAPGYSASQDAFVTYYVGTIKTPYVYTIAGTDFFGYGGDGGPATQAVLNYFNGAIADVAGNVYIADTLNNRLRKIDAATGNISTIAGTGLPGYSGDGGPAVNAQLNYPFMLAMDSKGALYVSEEDNFVVRRIDLSTGTISTYAGNPTAFGLGDGGPATNAQLLTPTGIAFDKSDNLYICAGNRVRKVDSGDKTISTIVGNGSWGTSGDGGPAVDAAMANPTAVAVFSRNLYIADEYNNAVRRVDLTSRIITTYAGVLGGPIGFGGDGGPATAAKFFYPQGVAVDPSGNVYIADGYNYRVRKVTGATGVISTFLGSSSPCFSFNSDGSPAAGNRTCIMSGLSFDSNGNLLVSEGSMARVKKVTTRMAPPQDFTATPVLSLASGTYDSAPTLTITDTMPGAAIYVSTSGLLPPTGVEGYYGPFQIPGTMTVSAIALAPGYMPSAPAQATYTITAKPRAVVTKVAGNGIYGFSGGGGPALSASMGTLNGVAVDNRGDEYLCDTRNNVIWKVDENTGKIVLFAGTGAPGYSGDGGPAKAATLNYPVGVAVDDRGHVFIVDEFNYVIREVMIGTGTIETVAGNGTPFYSGPHGQYGDGGPATDAVLMYPNGVAAIGGDLYIADGTNRVRQVHLPTGIIETVAGGSSGATVDGAVATDVYLNGPKGVFVDASKNFYFGASNQLWKVDAATGRLKLLAGNGISGTTGDGLQALDAQIDPSTFALDRAGNIYFSEFDKVRKVDAKTGVISRLAGMDFGGVHSSRKVPALAAGLCPSALAIDAADQIYVGDECNVGEFKVSFTIPAAKPTFSLSGGTYTGAQSIILKSTSPQATIFYTTDGSTPSLTSPVYSGPIALTTLTTVNAMAVSAGFGPSLVSSATYTITP